MATFNFSMTTGSIANVNAAASTGGTSLLSNAIHDVIFKGIEYATSKDGQWSFMNINFDGVNGGSFTSKTFGLKADANERKMGMYGEQPSQYEEFMLFVKHVLTAVAPRALEAISNGTLQFTPKGNDMFKSYVEFLAAATKPEIGTQTQIKLLADKTGRPTFPTFIAALNKSGEMYLRTSFAGQNLKFTDKELQKIKQQAEAKPTEAPMTMMDELDVVSMPAATLANDDFANMSL